MVDSTARRWRLLGPDGKYSFVGGSIAPTRSQGLALARTSLFYLMQVYESRDFVAVETVHLAGYAIGTGWLKFVALCPISDSVEHLAMESYLSLASPTFIASSTSDHRHLLDVMKASGTDCGLRVGVTVFFEYRQSRISFLSIVSARQARKSSNINCSQLTLSSRTMPRLHQS